MPSKEYLRAYIYLASTSTTKNTYSYQVRSLEDARDEDPREVAGVYTLWLLEAVGKTSIMLQPDSV